uniref:UspA n=1 Tax=Dechloromonas aromatica (strain RCB) TaxID=159087 RepID=Q47B81_DECAR
MASLNHLLAATDFSAPARHAAERAALVAHSTGAQLDLIHVVTLAPMVKLRQLIGDLPPEIEQRLLDASRDELQQLVALLHSHHGITANGQVVCGSLLDEITRHAGSLAAELLVFGSHGSSFMRHLLLGSTAERLLTRSTLPMLVVKQAAHEAYKTLLVPVDFSPSSRRALALAQAIAPRAEIILLHVAALPFEGKLRYAGIDDDIIARYQAAAMVEARRSLAALQARAAPGVSGIRLEVRQGDPSQSILQYEQEFDCDLIVIGKHGESLAEDLLLGSVARHVLEESQSDLLISL